ncbi:MAG: DUF1493 family protein [Chthonomonadales bacterium]
MSNPYVLTLLTLLEWIISFVAVIAGLSIVLNWWKRWTFQRRGPLPDQQFSELGTQVRKFVAEERGEPIEYIRLETRVEEDLGCTGDDADEFMLSFATRFEVDLTGMEFGRHFGPEASWPFEPMPPDLGHFPVTVGHLITVAENGKWIDPPRIG